jgi:hypothetical protein
VRPHPSPMLRVGLWCSSFPFCWRDAEARPRLHRQTAEAALYLRLRFQPVRLSRITDDCRGFCGDGNGCGGRCEWIYRSREPAGERAAGWPDGSPVKLKKLSCCPVPYHLLSWFVSTGRHLHRDDHRDKRFTDSCRDVGDHDPGCGYSWVGRTKYVRTDSVTEYGFSINSQWIVYHAASNRFFVADPDFNRILVISATTETEIGTIPVPGAYGIDLTPDGSVLYAGSPGTFRCCPKDHRN